MAARGEIERLRERCLQMAVEAIRACSGDIGDAIRFARDFEAHIRCADEVRPAEVEELIAAARCVIANDEGSRLRLISALQAMDEPIR